MHDGIHILMKAYNHVHKHTKVWVPLVKISVTVNIHRILIMIRTGDCEGHGTAFGLYLLR